MGSAALSEAELDISAYASQAGDLFRAYNENKDDASLRDGISAAELVVKHAPKSSGQSLEYTWKLAHYLRERYETQGNKADLEQSIDTFRDWLENAPDDHFERPFVLCLLAGALCRLFKASNERPVLEEALRLAERAVRLSALDPTYHLVYLRTVQEQLAQLWKSFAELDVLDQLIQATREVLEESTKRNDAERWRDIDGLNRALYQRFEKSGDVADLRDVLPLARVACESMPKGFPRGCNMYSHLSKVLAKSFEAGILPLSGLDESIEALHTAMSMEPIELRDRIGLLVNLSNRHREAYEHGRGVHFLDLAIEYGQKVLQLTPADDPERPNHCQGLAINLKLSFQHSGKQELLDEAIEMYRDALSYTHLPDEDKALISSNLSIALQTRYETSAAVVDLEEAVSVARSAVAWTPAVHHFRCVALNTLGSSLSSLYSRLRRIEDLDEAIVCAREAAACSWDKVDAGMYLNNLSTKLARRYEALDSDADRLESLEFARKAVGATASRQQKYALITHNLSNRLYQEYLVTKRRGDRSAEILEESIHFSRLSIEHTGKSHIDWSDYAYWLGWRQMEFATLIPDEESGWRRYDIAIDTFRDGFLAVGASPIGKVKAGRMAALMLLTRQRWDEADTISREVLQLLSHASPRSMSRQDMQHRLSGLSNISTFAAVASLNCGQDPAKALGLLELGRGLIAGFLIGSRSDISALQATGPQIASEYRELVDELSQTATPRPGEDIVQHRQQLTRRLEALERDIRTLPGLSRFQLPASDEQLKELAASGPLVCFNVTKFRSDAFIITAERVSALPLPLLLEDDLKEYSQCVVGERRITRCGLAERSATNAQLSEVLLWLWNVAVKPVVDYLNIPGRPGTPASDLPRLWWVASGRMGLMPLHAAGSGWETSGENTPSRVVSSYVHTLKALAYSREKSKRSDTLRRSILAVDAPSIPGQGWAELNTAPEMAAISSTAEIAGIPSTILTKPTVASVIDEMRNNAIVHFACHGDPDFDDPSRMSLILCTDQHAADRLTVSRLFEEKHDHAELAYLSACCTAQQYSDGLLDEGIHLGSVFQLMGFPAVVATLWEADDAAAADVAATFYRRLLDKDSDGLAAGCLHDALMELRSRKLGRRKKKSDDILAWAPFIHIGI
ncbi:CHAT domain-containing protein [Macrophomina phaseolina]|uniref:CHAT domain-containing protein n=1 Tax=Macrophomina phaseolina TaxID=35725 RepID=A0ABQ8FVS0_9PEZI|nr:CHAT domain-containing protein [Macrophomina phaseolina]